MINYKSYVILLGFDNAIDGFEKYFPFLTSGTDLNNALRHFLDFEYGISLCKTDNLTTPELISKIPQMVLSIYELKPDNMIYFGDNKNEPTKTKTNINESESIKDVKTSPVVVKDTYGNDVMLYENNSQT